MLNYFSNKTGIEDIFRLLDQKPNQKQLIAKLELCELSVDDIGKLIDYIRANLPSESSLLLAQSLLHVVKLVFQNTELMFLVMDHPLTPAETKEQTAERLIKRIDKLKVHPTFQNHQNEYLMFEMTGLKILGMIRLNDDVPEEAVPLFKKGLETSKIMGNPVLEEQMQRLLLDAKQRIVQSEVKLSSMSEEIKKLEYAVELKTRDLSFMEKSIALEEVYKQRKAKADLISAQVEKLIKKQESLEKSIEEGNLTIQLSKTRLELLEKRSSDQEQLQKNLEEIHLQINERSSHLENLSRLIVEKESILADLSRAKGEVDLLNQVIEKKVDELSRVEAGLVEKNIEISRLANEERMIRTKINDLQQQESSLQIVVDEMDEKIKKAIEYTYRQTELEEEQARLGLVIEKMTAQVSSLRRKIDDLSTSRDMLSAEFEENGRDSFQTEKGE